MNISIIGRKIDLTEAIKDYIISSIEEFKKYNLDIISIHAIISKETKKGKDEFVFEFTLNIAHIETVVIRQKDKDLYSAIDVAVDRVSKVLRRHHDKISSHKAVKFSEAIREEDKNNEEDEIVPVKLKSYKPMEIEEALEELKNSDDIFKVFYDKSDKLRVIYKQKNGKFGLY